ncbi:hypothetical protein CRUP_014193 [Coryphaenoides rupestris]|nr:hypothetical protein CRUP_014193 [Coryphaenoides rupestris]
MARQPRRGLCSEVAGRTDRRAVRDPRRRASTRREIVST